MPNGSLLKQYRPKGVIKVVKCLDVVAKGICQKPLLVSGLLNTAAPVNWASVLLMAEIKIHFSILVALNLCRYAPPLTFWAPPPCQHTMG